MDISFVVSPMKQEIDLRPGEIYEGFILVANPLAATDSFDYKVVVKPYFVTGDNNEPDLETVSDWSKIVNWITIEESTGTLAPNEKKTIHFKIKVPESVPAGGQYAMIGVSSIPRFQGKDTQVQDAYTLGSLIYAKVDGETVHEGQILENYIPGFSSSGSPVTFVTVTNTGNIHETLTVDLKVKNLLGGQVFSLTGEETDTYESIILPTSTRVVSRSLDGLPALGIFEVTQDASFINELSTNTKIILICPIWFMVLVLVLATTIITTIVYKVLRRKRTKKSKKQLHFEDTDDKIES